MEWYLQRETLFLEEMGSYRTMDIIYYPAINEDIMGTT